LWYYLLRAKPDFQGNTPEEHFKHAPIGLSTESRLPYYIWQALPAMFPEKLPGPGGWASFGFIFEPGQEIPIGFSLRKIGYPALEANCSLCHTGTYRASPSDTPKVILGAPAHTLDLEAFQHFLFACASDPRFTSANVLKAIGTKQLPEFFNRLPATHLALNEPLTYGNIIAHMEPPAGEPKPRDVLISHLNSTQIGAKLTSLGAFYQGKKADISVVDSRASDPTPIPKCDPSDDCGWTCDVPKPGVADKNDKESKTILTVGDFARYCIVPSMVAP